MPTAACCKTRRAACDEPMSPGSVVTNFHDTADWMKMRVPEV